MVAYLIGILLLVLMLYLNLIVSNKLLYPPVFFSLLWVIVLAIHWVHTNENFGIEVFPLKFGTILFLVLMNAFFSLAVFISYIYLLKYAKNRDIQRVQLHGHKEYSVDKSFFLVLNILSFIFVFLYLRKAILLTSSFDLGGGFIKELRTIINYHNGSFGWIKYSLVIINTNFFLRLILVNKINQGTLSIILAFFFAMVVAILSTGRTYIFFILIFAFSFWLFTKKVQFKKLILVGLVLIFFFSLLGYLTEKGADREADRRSNVSSMVQSFSEYLLGPVTAYQELLYSGESHDYGKNTFRFFHKLLYEVHILKQPPADLVQPFVAVPFQTNVYTVFGPYYKDFGILGASIFMLLLGGAYGILYFFSMQQRLFVQYFFLMMMHPLMMSFFEDAFFSLMSTWIQYLIISMLVFGLFVFRRKIE